MVEFCSESLGSYFKENFFILKANFSPMIGDFSLSAKLFRSTDESFVTEAGTSETFLFKVNFLEVLILRVFRGSYLVFS